LLINQYVTSRYEFYPPLIRKTKKPHAMLLGSRAIRMVVGGNLP